MPEEAKRTAARIGAPTLGGAITVLGIWVAGMYGAPAPTMEVTVALTTVTTAVTQRVFPAMGRFFSALSQKVLGD
jgi:hypothetical protein